MEKQPESESGVELTGADMGAIAHLYRGEVYRSTSWRSRLDNTTNWAVVTTGIALSLSFADEQASALPLVLVTLLVTVFLLLEARRYRYFNVWRARCRLLETDFYAPLLAGEGLRRDGRWNSLLAQDLRKPKFHVSYLVALGRRLRKNYVWILTVDALAYLGKLAIHPTALTGAEQLFARAAVGPVPGQAVVILGVLFNLSWIGIALWTLRIEHRTRRRGALIAIG
ncbi:MAG: DUF2270 domain-containing protein [Gammaproteobacteria bacterium]